MFPLDKNLRSLLTVSTTLLVLIGIGLLVREFYSLTALLGMVLIITYILLGPVNLMERGIIKISSLFSGLPTYQHLTRATPEANPRMLAVLIVYFVFFMTLTLSVVQLAPVLSNQLGEMGARLTTQALDASENLIGWVDRNVGQGTFRRLFEQDIRQAERQGKVKTHTTGNQPITTEEKQVIRQSVLHSTIDQLERSLASAVPNFIALAGGTVNGFVYFLAGLLMTFYFLIDGHRLKAGILDLLPRRDRQTGAELLTSFHQVMFSFIKGQVMLGVLTGLYMFLVYSVFHVPYAFLLSVIFAIAELLPVVGTWIGITIGLAVVLLTMSPVTAFWVWLCSYLYQTIKDNILQPKVVGDVMGLHPLVIILSLMICAQVTGLLGVLLALPLASAVNVILRLILEKDRQEKIRLEHQEAGGEEAHG